MLTQQQEQYYKQAEQAFAAGDVRQALSMLLELQAQAPGEKRVEQGVALCRQRMAALDPLGLEETVRAPAVKKRAGLRDFLPEPKQLALIIVVVLLSCVGFAMNQQAGQDAQKRIAIEQGLTELPPPPPGAMAIIVAQYITTGFFALLMATFLALYMLDELPGSDFEAAIAGVATAAAYSVPFVAVPVVGWIALAVMVQRKTGCTAKALAKAAAVYVVTLAVVGVGLNVVIAQVLLAMDALLPA